MPVSPPHICHLTVLNPALHSRIFYKSALSQLGAGYRVSIIGQHKASTPFEEQGVRIIPTGRFARLSMRRWSIRKEILRLARAQKADLYQIHTPELLGVAQQLRKQVPHARFVYDMHEDYRLNIRYGGYYPVWVRKALSERVRRTEQQFCSWGHGLILAERCYEGLLDFPKERTVIVENKYQAPREVYPPMADFQGRPVLLYTGTIAENWGLWQALELWQDLNLHTPVQLVVAGHTHDPELVALLRERVEASGWEGRFTLAGGTDYLPFEAMVGWMQRADLGLGLYTLRENIRDRIPTKFYEFMAHRLPVLHTPNPAWNELVQAHGAGEPLTDPLENGQVERIAGWLRKGEFPFFQQAPGPEVWSWKSEEQKLLGLVKELLG